MGVGVHAAASTGVGGSTNTRRQQRMKALAEHAENVSQSRDRVQALFLDRAGARAEVTRAAVLRRLQEQTGSWPEQHATVLAAMKRPPYNSKEESSEEFDYGFAGKNGAASSRSANQITNAQASSTPPKQRLDLMHWSPEQDDDSHDDSRHSLGPLPAPAMPLETGSTTVAPTAMPLVRGKTGPPAYHESTYAAGPNHRYNTTYGAIADQERQYWHEAPFHTHRATSLPHGITIKFELIMIEIPTDCRLRCGVK